MLVRIAVCLCLFWLATIIQNFRTLPMIQLHVLGILPLFHPLNHTYMLRQNRSCTYKDTIHISGLVFSVLQIHTYTTVFFRFTIYFISRQHCLLT